jgi:hypothetical protein
MHSYSYICVLNALTIIVSRLIVALAFGEGFFRRNFASADCDSELPEAVVPGVYWNTCKSLYSGKLIVWGGGGYLTSDHSVTRYPLNSVTRKANGNYCYYVIVTSKVQVTIATNYPELISSMDINYRVPHEKLNTTLVHRIVSIL